MLSSRILYQNKACIVINKLKGEAAQAAKTNQRVLKDRIVNLPKELKKILDTNNEIVQAAHRIDVPVTGCVLFALTKKALGFLNKVFAGEYEIPAEKQYWAIVEKPINPPEENGELTHWIDINEKHNKSFVYDTDGPGRKKASLKYRIIGEGTNYLFLEVELLSGRHHQIRAQLAAIGLYIKGDVKYSARRSEKTGGIRLHARSLSFPNPLNPKEKINVKADPPEIDNLWQGFMETV